MRKPLLFLISLVFVASHAFAAVDPLKAAPDMYKLLFENEKVRVMEVTFKSGQSIPQHSHPDAHFVTVLEPGSLEITKEDGSSNVVALAKDQVIWIPAETHQARNVGSSEVKLLVSEIKSVH